jgi:hypothetical protein
MRMPVVWRAPGYRIIPILLDTETSCTCLLAMWNGVTGKVLELIRNSLPHWMIPTRRSVRWQRSCSTDIRPVHGGKGAGRFSKCRRLHHEMSAFDRAGTPRTAL